MIYGPLTSYQTRQTESAITWITDKPKPSAVSILDYESSIQSSASFYLLSGHLDLAIDNAWTAEGLRRYREAGYAAAMTR